MRKRRRRARRNIEDLSMEQRICIRVIISVITLILFTPIAEWRLKTFPARAFQRKGHARRRLRVPIAKRPFRSTGSLSSYPGVSEDTFLPSSPTRSTAVVEFIEVSCGRFLMSVPQKKAALPIRRPRGPRSTGREAEFWFVRRPCERRWWHASLRQGSRLRCVRRRPRSRCWASG